MQFTNSFWTALPLISYKNDKVHPRTGHRDPEGEQRYNYSFFNLNARCGWVINATPRPLYPHKTRYPLYRSLGGLQGWFGLVRKISTLPGFDPRTVEAVASRCNDWVNPRETDAPSSPLGSIRTTHLCGLQPFATHQKCLTFHFIHWQWRFARHVA
jgi:hypothetical protein